MIGCWLCAWRARRFPVAVGPASRTSRCAACHTTPGPRGPAAGVVDFAARGPTGRRRAFRAAPAVLVLGAAAGGGGGRVGGWMERVGGAGEPPVTAGEHARAALNRLFQHVQAHSVAGLVD